MCANFKLNSECTFLWTNERIAGEVMIVTVNPSAADQLWYSVKHVFNLR